MNTLYERMGGDNAVKAAIEKFFAEIKTEEDLKPFFVDISISALSVHQLKLFKVIFGPEEEQPDPNEFLDFMLATHTRLFRDMGLNETHFDKVAECFVRAMQALDASQDIIDESLAILGPLRVVFEYGAKVAEQEKSYTPEEVKLLPTTTAQNMHLDEPTSLPDPAMIDIPDWLPEILAKNSECGNVRTWTCHLTDAFGRDGDNVIADTFMDMPYMNHHVYTAALMQMAFLPDGNVGHDDYDILPVVKYPRGPEQKSLSRPLFERMVVQFEATCHYFMMDLDITNEAVKQLRSYKRSFPNRQVRMVGGVFTPHVLRKTVYKLDVSGVVMNPKVLDRKSSSVSCGDTVSETELSASSHTDDGDMSVSEVKPRKRKGVWRRFLGWTKAL